MPIPASKPRSAVLRKKREKKPAPMTKFEMIQKMLADQKFIREAVQDGTSFKELREKYGYEFATV